VVALAQKYTHFPVKVEVGPGELMRRCEALDISRAREELGYEPQYSLEEGIKLYADWMKHQRMPSCS
jgi:nucleoside-diphosphate-sugar epimerase